MEQIKIVRFLTIWGRLHWTSIAREIFKRKPKALHVVGISEINMMKLVCDIRSTLGYFNGHFCHLCN